MKCIQNLSLTLAFATACLLGYANTAMAQNITWQPSVDMYTGETVETFVDTTGNLAVAYNASNDTEINVDTGELNALTTVNGVQFTPEVTGNTVTGSGGESITLNATNLTAMTAGSYGDGDFTSNGNIFHLLRGGSFELGSVTLGGLEIDQEYLVQVFTHDGRASRNTNSVVGFGDGSGSASPVGTSQLSNQDPDPLVEGDFVVGDSIIGTFTPTATSLTFNVFGSGDAGVNFAQEVGQAQINGLQLRRVEEVISLLGDFDMDGDVDLADLDQYNGNIGAAAVGALEPLDLDDDGTVDAGDFAQHYTDLVETSNGEKGTFAGDLNLDGTVSVLGDAFPLVGNLNSAATSWSQGDFNGDGTVSVLGDAFLLIGNLNKTNSGASAPAASAVPEPGTLSLLALVSFGALTRRRR